MGADSPVTVDPVEVTTRFATAVADLPAAWAFVMAKIELVGPDPSIEINPCWRSPVDSDEWTRVFTVVVSGMVKGE